MINTYLSEPSNLYVLLGSLISCVTSPFLKLLPCMPCLWNANTLSGKQTESRKMIVNTTALVIVKITYNENVTSSIETY